MPVSTESSVSGPYIPNGATTDFAFDFKATSASEVIAADQSGATISSALYSVTLDDDEGGTLSFSVAPTLAQYSQIFVVSNPALTQPSDFDNSGPSFNPAALTRALDRSAARDLKQQREIDRSMKSPFGEEGVTVPPESERQGKYWLWDADGNPSLDTPSNFAAPAVAAANAASLSAAFAESVAGPTYASTAAGLAATSEGEGFAVDNGDGTVTIYRNVGGSAVFQRSLATTAALGGPDAKQIAPGLSLHATAFGCAADGVTDDTAALQAMADYAKANKVRDVYLPGGTLIVSGTVFWPYGVRVHGARSEQTGNFRRAATEIKVAEGGTFTPITYPGGTDAGTKAVFLFNSRNGSSNEQDGFFYGGGMSDVLFQNQFAPDTPIAGLVAVCAAGHNYCFERVGTAGFLKTILRAPWNYSDNFTLVDVFAYSPEDLDVYQFEIAGHGDSVKIIGWNLSANMAGVWIRGDNPNYHFTYNAHLIGGINGDIRNDCTEVLIDAWHCETGRFIYTRGSATTIRGCNIIQSTGESLPAFEYQDLNSVTANVPVRLSIEDTTVRWAGRSQAGAASGVAGSALFEVSMPQQGELHLKNVRRNVNGAGVELAAIGWRVAKADGTTPVANFKDYAEHLCREGYVRPNYKVDYGNMACEPFSGGDTYIGAVTATTRSAGAWSGATGTFYYQVVRLFDPVALVGAATRTEGSATISSTSQVAQVTVFDANTLKGVYRVYRGTSAGSYTHFADIAGLSCNGTIVFTDEGDRIAGTPWTARTAGAVDSYQRLATGCSFSINGAGRIRTNEPYVVTVGDADKTLDRWATETIVNYTTTLTAERSLTTQVGIAGARVRVNRRGGAFFLKVKASFGSDRLVLTQPRSFLGFGEIVFDNQTLDWVAVSEGEDAKAPNPAIASPSGGATVDAEARTAIDAIRAALTAQGVTL